MVDPDERRHGVVQKWLQGRNLEVGKVQAFTDYRKMFDKVGKEIDAVFIATPNHHHALPAMIAMQLGKNVYCEKPVCHDIAEARAMRAMAAKSKVATQMGNQGHCEDGYRKLCEYIWAGVIGKVTETHSWTDRANGGEGPRPPKLPVPAGLHWDEWIGPAPYRDFHDDLHPHEWHGWYDFGNGSIGNMGCHVLDGVYWALKLEHPTSIEVEQVRGGSDERYPMGSRVRWDVPARGDMPPLKVYWYEGLNEKTTGKPAGNLRTAKGDDRNLPVRADRNCASNIRTKSLMPATAARSMWARRVSFSPARTATRMHIVPDGEDEGDARAAQDLAPPQGRFHRLHRCLPRAGKPRRRRFRVSQPLTEFTLLGNLAQVRRSGSKGGVGRTWNESHKSSRAQPLDQTGGARGQVGGFKNPDCPLPVPQRILKRDHVGLTLSLTLLQCPGLVTAAAPGAASHHCSNAAGSNRRND